MNPDATWVEALVAAAWQSSAWLAAGLGAAALLSRRPARAHAALLLCTVAAAMTPLLGAAVRVAGLGILPGLNRAVDVADLAAGLDRGDGLPAAGGAPAWPLVLVLAWIALSALAAARLAVSALRGRRLLASAAPAGDRALAAVARRAADRLGLERPPRILQSARVRCPVIWCWGRRPRLIVPESMRGRGAGDLLGVLCHELAHRKRRDHLATLAGEAALVALPWNPLAWWAVHRLGELSEQACDRWAVSCGEPPEAYAEALLGLVPQPRLALAQPALDSRRAVAKRIRRILEPRPGAAESGRRFVAAAAAVTALAVTTAVIAHRRPPTIEVVDAADLVPDDAPDVVTIPHELDLGSSLPGLPRSRELLLCNRSREPRDVIGYAASCGCTTVEGFEPRTLDAGECMKLLVTMTAPVEPGARKTKYVTFDIEGQPPLELAVHLLAAGPP